jgi:hypothetical protein
VATTSTPSTFGDEVASTSTNLFTGAGIAFSTTTSDYYTISSSTIPNTSTDNTVAGLQTFGNVSTTDLSALSTISVGGTSTTTIAGDDATSTFAGGVQAISLNITGAVLAGALQVNGSATSTFANGIDITGGCVSVRGVCVGQNSSADSGAALNKLLSDAGFELTAGVGDVDAGRSLLLALAKEKQGLTASTTIGDFYAGHALAGLEIVAPRVIADTLVTSALEPVNNMIDMRLGTTSVFTIHRVDSTDLSVSFAAATSTSNMLAVSIDADGNATFAGQLAAAGLTIGTPEKPSGITMFDDSGAVYCTKIVRGQLVTVPGTCATATATSSVTTAPPAASSTPAVAGSAATSTPDTLDTQTVVTQQPTATSSPNTVGIQTDATQQPVTTGTDAQPATVVSVSPPVDQSGGDAANQSPSTVL